MAPSSSSSFDDSQIKYDVFISFNGKDTRRGFRSHLVKELRRENIGVYEDEKMNRGEEISSSLRTAIKESQISIVVFSKNYASSRWCLDELEEIMECRKVNKQIVLPVFYNIDPSHVRHQRGTYENAFARHELSFQGNSLKVQNWRSALKNAADLFGYDSSRYGTDFELIGEIVKDVLLRVNDIYPSESNGLVGIDQHLDRIRSFLEMESKEVQILGICGMGGIGKTTIAQLAFDKFSSRYEGSYFLDNVREESQKHGLKYLGEKLISELQEEKSTFIRRRLIGQRKVLVVLDDVDTPAQLQHLVTEGFHWGPGSRVIVTSRNKQTLIDGGVHAIHEIEKLDFEESLHLFSLIAFKNSHPKKGYEELSKQAAAYANGLPLALKVLGSHLYSCDRETWKSTLRKLEMYTHPQIQDVLKMSFEGLDDVERDVFLDIAFFFKGEDKDYVKRLLDVNNPFAAHGIKGLLDKALISISNDNGIDAIKGIVLHASLFKDVRLNVDAFKNMTNLRVIKFYPSWHVRSCNVHPPSFLSFSDELRCLGWHGYPYPYPEKLDGHSMPNNHVGKLWKLVQGYVNSKRMSLGSSKQSTELLDLTKAQKTEWEDMRSCQVSGYFLSSKEISESDLVTSKFEILCSSSVRGLSELRRITHGDSGLEILPVNELCCLRYFEDPSLSDCRQMNQAAHPIWRLTLFKRTIYDWLKCLLVLIPLMSTLSSSDLDHPYLMKSGPKRDMDNPDLISLGCLSR
ncbi:TMV resistance protein N-like [Neltuma alba]|uniref:TMV resistance protein N-like n=1 Tax=Neltuma alba TaxID=207710 RepID=UPI0010A59D6E|nr:TMV resistance protein N-like [Prosopis alba]